MWFRLLVAEIRRYLFRLWSYRVDTFGELALWLVAYPILIVIFSSAAPTFDAEARTASLIGFLVWNLCIGALSSITNEVATEAREGSLEAVLLSPVPPVGLFAMRTLAFLLVQGLQTSILGLIFVFLLDAPLRLTGLAFFLLGLTVLGALGASFALGGATIVHKQTASIVSVVSLLALLGTGALVPLNSLGPVFLWLKWLAPTAWGIDAMRAVILHGATWQSLTADFTLLGLTVQSLALLVCGCLIFQWGVKRAQRQGALSEY